MPDSSPVDFAAYKTVRDEIAHEDNLAGTRLSWFMASQAFLLSALAIAYKGYNSALPNMKNDFFFPLIPIMAISSCTLILLGIIAGGVALRRWRRGRDGWIMPFGWIAPLGLPIVFGLAWIYLLIRGLAG
jgi:hypothetical protein